MKTKRLLIKKFRSIKESQVIFGEKNLVVLVGGNESGKSNFLRAIKLFCDPNTVLEIKDRFDFRRDEETRMLGIFNHLEHDDLSQIIENYTKENLIILRIDDTYYIYDQEDVDEIANSDDYDRLDGIANAAADILRPLTQEQAGQILGKLNVTYLSTFDGDSLVAGKNINMDEIIANPNAEKSVTILSLLSLGNLTPEVILEADQEERERLLLKGASNISNKINEYWKDQEEIKFNLSCSDRVLNVHIRDGKIRENDEKDWIWVSPEERSAGFRWYLTFYCRFLSNKERKFLLIDDPGIYLNAKAQRALVKHFYCLVDDNQNSLVYTTHSPYMISDEHLKDITLVDKDIEGTKADNNWGGTSHRNLPEPLKSIGFCLLENLVNKRNLLVEGFGDVELIRGVSDLFRLNAKDHIEVSEFRIVDSKGSDEMIPIAQLIETHNQKSVLLFDNDKQGECDQAKSKYKLKAATLKEVDGKTRSTKKTIEDYLPIEKYLASLNCHHSEIYGSKWKNVQKDDLAVRESVLDMINRTNNLKIDKNSTILRLIDNLNIDDFLKRTGEFNEAGEFFKNLFIWINSSLK